MSVKILLIAPHPFFQERGTPIAVDLLIKALTERGYLIDLITFNEGNDVSYPGLTIHRVKPFPTIKSVRPGFSIKKILLDILVFFKFISLMIQNKYKVVHAVEESAFMALLICPFFRTPYIYDMDSSMATQIIDKMAFLRPFEKSVRFLESMPMRYATLVIPVCNALADEVKKYRNNGIFILKDVPLANKTTDNTTGVINIREKYKLTGNLLMYIGNLESYQGIDLMLEAFSFFHPDHPSSQLVIIGGENEHIELYQNKCQQLLIQPWVTFMGKQPIALINAYMSQTDILLSPRIQGINTPMKIYSYLDSGVVVLATNLPTHTQVIDTSTACLTDATPEAYAEGMRKLSCDKKLRRSLAKNAKALIDREHSYPVFKSTLYKIYDSILTKS